MTGDPTAPRAEQQPTDATLGLWQHTVESAHRAAIEFGIRPERYEAGLTVPEALCLIAEVARSRAALARAEREIAALRAGIEEAREHVDRIAESTEVGDLDTYWLHEFALKALAALDAALDTDKPAAP